jgi:pimeloyl-ACP methyl ester carboxylesterase
MGDHRITFRQSNFSLTVKKEIEMKPTFLGRLSNRLIRALMWTGIFIVVLASAGMIYQTAAAQADRQNFPPPGNLIDVGGFKMHIHCVGEGSPTVVLETLSGGTSSYWGWVQPEVAKKTRVCVYDRAGRGWSEPDPQPQSLARTVRNLHTLLANANIAGPYVLAGHSIGGIYVRQFAAEYPEEVAGVVLVDAANPFQFDRHPEMLEENESYLQVAKFIPAFARLGIGHLFFALGGEIDFAEMKEPQKSEIKAAWSSPEYFESQYAETAAGRNIFADGQKLGSLGDLPLIVLTQGNDSASSGWIELQNELALLSTDSLHITVDDATHASLAFNPAHAQAVSDTVLRVVDAARSGERLTR